MGKYQYVYNGQIYARQEISREFGKDASTFEYRMRRYGLTFQEAVDNWNRHTPINRDNALIDYRPTVPDPATRAGDLNHALHQIAAFCRECAYYNTHKHKCPVTDCHLYGLAKQYKGGNNERVFDSDKGI